MATWWYLAVTLTWYLAVTFTASCVWLCLVLQFQAARQLADDRRRMEREDALATALETAARQELAHRKALEEIAFSPFQPHFVDDGEQLRDV